MVTAQTLWTVAARPAFRLNTVPSRLSQHQGHESWIANQTGPSGIAVLVGFVIKVL